MIIIEIRKYAPYIGPYYAMKSYAKLCIIIKDLKEMSKSVQIMDIRILYHYVFLWVSLVSISLAGNPFSFEVQYLSLHHHVQYSLVITRVVSHKWTAERITGGGGGGGSRTALSLARRGRGCRDNAYIHIFAGISPSNQYIKIQLIPYNYMLMTPWYKHTCYHPISTKCVLSQLIYLSSQK